MHNESNTELFPLLIKTNSPRLYVEPNQPLFCSIDNLDVVYFMQK